MEFANGFAELFTFVDIGDDHIKTGRHDTEGTCRQHDTFIVEARHQNANPFAFRAEPVLERYLAILKDEFAGVGTAHAELVELWRPRKSGHSAFDQKGGDAFRARIRICLGVNDKRICVRAVGDPHLAAAEDVTVVALFGPELHRDHIRARLGLRHGKRSHMFTRNELWQKAPLLFHSSMAIDLVDTEIGMRGVGQAHGS